MVTKSDLELVDIQKINPRIRLDVRYATTDNFTGKKVYSSPKCFLRRPVAEKLNAVQEVFERYGLGIKVFDAYRPLSVQKIFWEICPNPLYVADPAEGSRHNRGASVDLTLVDGGGCELPMPSDFDDFSEKAHRNRKEHSKEALTNSMLLEKVMVDYGFTPYEFEWWHFDYSDWKDFPIEDIPIETL